MNPQDPLETAAPTTKVAASWLRRLQGACGEGLRAYDRELTAGFNPSFYQSSSLRDPWDGLSLSDWLASRRGGTSRRRPRPKQPWSERVEELLASPPRLSAAQQQRLATGGLPGARLMPVAWRAFLTRLGGEALADQWTHSLTTHLDEPHEDGRLTWWALDRLKQQGVSIPLTALVAGHEAPAVWPPLSNAPPLRPLLMAWALYHGGVREVPREQLTAAWVRLWARPEPKGWSENDPSFYDTDLLRLRRIRRHPRGIPAWEGQLLLGALVCGDLQPDLQEHLLSTLEHTAAPIGGYPPGPARAHWIGEGMRQACLLEHQPLKNIGHPKRAPAAWRLQAEQRSEPGRRAHRPVPGAWLHAFPDAWAARIAYWLEPKETSHNATIISLLCSSLGDMPVADPVEPSAIPVPVAVRLVQLGTLEALRLDSRMFTGFSVPWTQVHPQVRRALLLHPDRELRTNFIRLMGLQPTSVVDTRFDTRPRDEHGGVIR